MPDVIYAIMRQRRNTYAYFTQNNPVLEDGQIGIINTGQHRGCFKVGDGATGWNSLPWVTDYSILFNKPAINGVTLAGNVSLPQIGAASVDALNSVLAVASGASKALVFDSPAQLTAWMAGQVQPFNPPVAPGQLRTGWKALFRSQGDSDLWRDGDAQPPRWREAEVTIDLSGYRPASAQDELNALLAPKQSPVFTGVPQVPAKTGTAGNNDDLIATEAQVYAAALAVSAALALKADIDSPALTGIPLTPRPDGSVPEQIEQVGRVNDLFSEFELQMEASFPALMKTLPGGENGDYIGTISGMYISALQTQ
jgi:hypothetical protein